MSNAIRLTNKTAKALRKSALRMKTTYFVCAAVLSVMMAVLAVYLGLKWLVAVPIVVVTTVLLDTLIMIRGRSVYLSLIGQAICTEAAAREIRAGMSESRRREKAITDMISVNADIRRAQRGKEEENSGTSGRNDERRENDKPQEDHEREPQRRRRKGGFKLIKNEQAR